MIRLFNRIVSARGLVFYLTEDLLIWLSVWISVTLFGSPDLLIEGRWIFLQGLLVISIFHLCFYYGDLYDFSTFSPDRTYFIRLLQVTAIGVMILWTILFVFNQSQPGTSAARLGKGLGFAVFLTPALVFGWRSLFAPISKKFRIENRFLILGTQDVAIQVAKELLKRKALGFKVVGFLDEDRKNLGKSILNPKIIGTYDNLAAIAAKEKVTQVIIAAPERRGRLPIQDLLGARAQGVQFVEGTRFYEQLSGKVFLEDIKPSGFIYAEGFSKSGLSRWGKRATGIVVSLGLMILTFPLFLLLAILIKLDSRGPIFYRQERVGEEGRPFTLLKFRSMREDAELRSGPVWAKKEDPRVTRVGRILRKTRLDELPQLINIFQGDMSFVGPRPERPHFVDQLLRQIPFYSLRFAVKPGLTGWAQICFPYGASVEDAREKLRYDLYYIKNLSFLFDLLIIFKTVKIVLFGRGAR